MEQEYGRFWMVWRAGSVPTYKHESLRSAQMEAERLARQHRGDRFHVLEVVGWRQVDDMRRVDFVEQELPF